MVDMVIRVARILAMVWLVAATDAGAGDKIVYQLGFLPQGGNANVYVALQKGLFAAENLDVEVLTGRGATDSMTKVATGVADLGEVTFDIYLAANAQGPVPVKAVMPEFTRPPDALLTTTDSGITTLNDVGGRKVATSPFTSSNLVWPVILKHNGVDPSSVTLIKAEPSTLAGMLATNKVDAIINWATGAPAVVPALTAVGKELRVLPWSGSGYEGYSQTVVASSKIIAERPAAVGRFLKVMRQSLQLVYTDPAQAAEIMMKLLPQADLVTLRAQIDACQPYFLNEITRRDGLGVFNAERVKKSWEWVAAVNNYPLSKIDPMSVIDARFVTP
jgi:NitT/TauT family transport system substrate-binding protein